MTKQEIEQHQAHLNHIRSLISAEQKAVIETYPPCGVHLAHAHNEMTYAIKFLEDQLILKGH